MQRVSYCCKLSTRTRAQSQKSFREKEADLQSFCCNSLGSRNDMSELLQRHGSQHRKSFEMAAWSFALNFSSETTEYSLPRKTTAVDKKIHSAQVETLPKITGPPELTVPNTVQQSCVSTYTATMFSAASRKPIPTRPRENCNWSTWQQRLDAAPISKR